MKSRAELFLEQPPEVRREKLASLSEEAAVALKYDWRFWARPSQLLPEGAWNFWLLMAGRGFGKTRVGAEAVREWVRTFPVVNLVGPTSESIKNVMIEGESGILAICPPGERPQYVGRELRWPNGAKSLLYSAEEPDRLRGPQHYKLWADELAAWRYPEAWDQAKFGLRLGAMPQAVITTTPRPTKVVIELSKDAATRITTGTTYENRTNLSKDFFQRIITKYEGTRVGRQELNAELLLERQNALWRRANIDANRIAPAACPELARVVVSIDPAVTSNVKSDETGIGAVGRDRQTPPHFYVLEDVSGTLAPKEWGERAVALFKNRKADRVIGEVNNGGDLVEANIRNVDPSVPFKAVHATRGKEKRAEPVAALYEQNRVHHVGFFPELEDQMVEFDPSDMSGPSPDRMDMVVWGLAELSEQGFGREPYVEIISGARRGNEERGWRKLG